MPADNEVYEREGGKWRDEHHFLSLLAGLMPARMAYMCGVLVGKLQLNLAEKAVLDLGCGGGRVAEEMARLGCHVLGIDPSAR